VVTHHFYEIKSWNLIVVARTYAVRELTFLQFFLLSFFLSFVRPFCPIHLHYEAPSVQKISLYHIDFVVAVAISERKQFLAEVISY
jgi:hypothetical protein